MRTTSRLPQNTAPVPVVAGRPAAPARSVPSHVNVFPPEHSQYILLSLFGTICGVVGNFLDSDLMALNIPALFGATGAIMATLRFVFRKQDAIGFSITVSTFVFFQLYQLNPLNRLELLGELVRFTPNEAMVGGALSNGLAGALLLSANLWAAVWRGQGILARFGRPVDVSRQDRILFFGFVLIFVLVAIPNLVWGGGVRDSINGVLYGYSSWESTGTGPRVFEDAEGSAGSLANLRNLAPSLLILSFLLYRSAYRVAVFCALPLIVIWSGGILLGGTRTYLLAFVMVCFVIFASTPAFRRRVIVYCVLGILLFLLVTRVLLVSRTAGLRNFSWESFSMTSVASFQGNEGLIYHMDAVAFSRSGFKSPWSTGNPVGDFALGLVYEPFEALVIWVPRSLMPWKPQDPTWQPYNVFTWNVQMGRSDNTVLRTYSAGFAGRDLMRWGPLGVLIPVFWFGAFFHLMRLFYAANPSRLTNRMLAGILTGIGFSMMRDINFMWTLPFLPALAVVIIAQLMAVVTVPRWRPHAR